MPTNKLAILLVLSIGLVSATSLGTVQAQSDSIPKWIKTAAEYWVNDQISDSEYLRSLQYLVENKMLIIPDSTNDLVKSTENSIKEKTTLNDTTLELKAFYLEGDKDNGHYWLIYTISDQNGNAIIPNGELFIRILDFDENEIYKNKKYLSTNSFQTLTNDVSNETTDGIKHRIAVNLLGTDRDYKLGIGYIELTYKTLDNSYTNTLLLDHLPFGEGYFGKETGFIKKFDIEKTLKLSNFFIKANNGGHYIDENLSDNNNRDEFKEYFKINLNTKSSHIDGFGFLFDQAYLEDENGDIYIADSQSVDNYTNIFLGESYDYEGGNGYLLFEKVPRDIESLKLILKLSKVNSDGAHVQYEDEIEFSLN